MPIEVATLSQAPFQPTPLDVEEFTRDFVFERLAAPGQDGSFRLLVAELLACMGYHPTVLPPGVGDCPHLIATADPLGLTAPRIKVLANGSPTLLHIEPLVSLAQGLVPGDVGLVVCLGGLTEEAQVFAARSQIRLMDQAEIVSLVMQHYDALAPSTQARIPLRRVLAPALD